jgi:CarboxypepD_reg-like domain
MKKYFLPFILLVNSISLFGQTSYYYVSGKVIDAATKNPLQGASVFAQNTTMGTATDAAGDFTLRLTTGGYDLAITFTGYETVVKRVSSSDSNNRNIVVIMKQKEKAMEEVAIKTSNELKDGLEKYGSFFMENFIGKTNNSKQCSIQNKEVLKFYFSKKRNRLKVLATAPVEIENAALGYKIKYTLDSFTHDYNTSVSTFTGYPLFEEMTSLDSTQNAIWHSNRMLAYNGSILHFMRSVYNKNLQQEGFEIQFVVNNNGTDTALKLGNYYAALNYTKEDSLQVVDIMPNQQQIAVVFKNEAPDKEYVLQNDEQPKSFQLSVMTIAAAQSIAIEQNGFYYDQNDITINGYWAWEKTADMVPYDFKPN